MSHSEVTTKKLQVVAQYDSTGKSKTKFATPIDVVQIGNTLRDKTFGFVFAEKDAYGDWVSPALRAIRVKSKFEVLEVAE